MFIVHSSFIRPLAEILERPLNPPNVKYNYLYLVVKVFLGNLSEIYPSGDVARSEENTSLPLLV